jgi:hypothetical protein
MTRTTTEPQLGKRALFEALGYRPHPGQLLVHRSRAPRRVLACGSRWGKTVCAAYEAVAAMLEPREKSLGWIVAPSHDLADRVFRRIVDVVETHLKHRVRAISPREQRIVLTNLGGGTSEVRGKSADRLYSLLGEGLDWLVVDEAAQFDREIWDEYLSQRLVDRRGWALLISTPKGPGWFLRMYRRGMKGKDADYESWSQPSITNPHLDAAAIEAERARLRDDIYRQEYLGEFVDAGSEPCEVCKGPRPGASGMIIIEGEEAEPARCPECNQVVDETGLSAVALWPDGSRRLTIIRETGFDWPFGDTPDQMLKPETVAADEAARIGQSLRPKWEFTPEELALAKAGVPIMQWPEGKAAPQVQPNGFVPGPLNGRTAHDD